MKFGIVMVVPWKLLHFRYQVGGLDRPVFLNLVGIAKPQQHMCETVGGCMEMYRTYLHSGMIMPGRFSHSTSKFGLRC